MLLRDTLAAVLRNPLAPPLPPQEVERQLVSGLTLSRTLATVLTGVRRCGKSCCGTWSSVTWRRDMACARHGM